MIISQMELDQQLPTELPAKIHYVCKSKTKAGNYQAKCSYLHNNREYPGIIFGPDNEDWFEDLEPGTVIQARSVKQGKHPDYPGDLKGDALRLAQQQELTPTPPDPLATLPELLRQAANLIEKLSSQSTQVNQPSQVAHSKTFKPKLKFRSQSDWADIIESIIMTVPSFQKGFSSITLNAYIESTFDDFWPGDIAETGTSSRKVLRWRPMACRALAMLLDYGTIQRIQGTTYHYQLTESTRSKITTNK
jgi:hypothetical protein